MAEILGEAIEEVVVYRKRVYSHVCDNCGVTILANNKATPESMYYHFTIGHDGWGADSADSIYHYDICPECLDDFMTKYFKDEKEPTAFMYINREHSYPKIRQTERKETMEVVKFG